MPTLNIKPKETKPQHHNTDARKLRMEAYNNTSWKKLRDTYIKQNPLCELCLIDGKVTPATSVHHTKSPFKNGSVNWNLLLDYSNLKSVCHKCHADIHNQQNGNRTISKIIEELDTLLGDNCNVNE